MSRADDDSPSDKGWELDEGSICFVEEYEETVVGCRAIDG